MAARQKVHEFMLTFGQPVRYEPTADIPDEERLLRSRLVVEEALEFAEAMGVKVTGIADELHEHNAHTVQVELSGAPLDVVEAADALADLTYVTEGSAWTLGVPLDDVFREVHRSNMAKADPVTGKPNVSPDGKVLKPEGWTPPDVRGVLQEAGWAG